MLDATEEESSYAYRPIEPLDLDELKTICGLEMGDAVGGLGEGSEISESRRKALRYYHGRPFGNEIEGRSQVVLTDVADTVEWIMPTLMRMLVPNNQRVIRFKPKRQGPEAKKQAQIATRAVNHIIMEQNDGFSLCHDWFKTCLIEKNGIVKIYYEELLEPKRSTYRGLDEMASKRLEES